MNNIGSINFSSSLNECSKTSTAITHKLAEYRLYVNKHGIMTLQTCQRVSTGVLVWKDIPTVYEETPIAQAYVT